MLKFALFCVLSYYFHEKTVALCEESKLITKFESQSWKHFVSSCCDWEQWPAYAAANNKQTIALMWSHAATTKY